MHGLSELGGGGGGAVWLPPTLRGDPLGLWGPEPDGLLGPSAICTMATVAASEPTLEARDAAQDVAGAGDNATWALM